MILASAIGEQPTWLTLLVAGLGGVAGGVFSLCGVWLTARANRQKDKTEREARWRREDELSEKAEWRRLLIDVAEVVRERQAWVVSVDRGYTHEPSHLAAPRFQVAARVRLSGSAAMIALWERFENCLRSIENEIMLGNLHHDGATNRTMLEKQELAAEAVATSDILLLLLRMLLVSGSHRFDGKDLVRRAKVLPILAPGGDRDGRYREALNRWVSSAELPDSLWTQVWGKLDQ
ncbi:hypothetical protein [Micromonospora aurantiaca (nom. illeg.)]